MVGVSELGELNQYENFADWLITEPFVVAALGGVECRFIFDSYESDAAPQEMLDAVAEFRSIDDSALRASAPWIYMYYRDVVAALPEEDLPPPIDGPEGVWDHVTIGRVVLVQRDTPGDGRIYLSVECECDWEAEHGLNVVFRGGHTVTMVGEVDGHVTNAHAYGDSALVDVVYRSFALNSEEISALTPRA